MGSTEEDELTKLENQLKTIQTQAEIEDAKKALAAKQKGTSPELAQLQKTSDLLTTQKSIAESQKAIAEAQAGTVAAQFPKGTTKPLEGDIKTDEKFGYTATLVSYQAMKEQAKLVANQISALPNKTKQSVLAKAPSGVVQEIEKQTKILIVNDLDFAVGDFPLSYVKTTIETLEDSVAKQKKVNDDLIKLSQPTTRVKKEELEKEVRGFSIPISAPDFGLSAISGIVSSVADIIGYFQVDYTIKGQEFKLDNQAIASIVAGQIRNTNSALPVVIENFYFAPESEILKLYVGLIESRQNLDSVTEQLKNKISDFNSGKEKIQDLEKQLNDPKVKATDKDNIRKELEKIKQKPQLSDKWIDRAKGEVTNSEGVSKAVIAFAEAVTKATDEKTSILLKAALRNHISKLEITHLLYLKIISSGGEAMTLKSRFRSGKTAFVGGCAITYVLATTDGQVVSADTIPVLAQLNYDLSLYGQRVYNLVPLDGTGAKNRIQRFKEWVIKG